jgi:RimJ/RimL family protein N-acetyltransferase
MQIKIGFRMAEFEDAEMYYQWANDDIVRRNSYEQKKIYLDEHIKWFKKKLASSACFFYLFMEGGTPMGQVRIEKMEDETIIGISIDFKYRGKGLGVKMLNMACEDYFSKFPKATIVAYVKEENMASYVVFKEAKFVNDVSVVVKGIKSVKLSKTKK